MPQERKSPIGYPEVSGITRPGVAATTFPDISKTQTPMTVYDSKYYNDPLVQAHERIHQGQYADNLIGKVPLDILLKVLNSAKPQDSGKYWLTNTTDASETPAYLFEKYDPKYQPAFNNYINMLQQTNPNKIYSLLASSPVEYQRGYINSGPQVPNSTIQPESVGIFSAVKQYLGQLIGNK